MANEILTVAQHNEADRLAAAAGVPLRQLMENAGRAVAGAVVRRWSKRQVLVLCGPGNNGGDGYVAARYLSQAGWPVRVMALGPPKDLAAQMAERVQTVPWTLTEIDAADLVVDALFGAGLSRPVAGPAAEALSAITVRGPTVVAVDVPSGVFGDTGAILGAPVKAALTVTFFRKKPGHLLYPGRDFCGEVLLADIATPPALLDQLGVDTWENAPSIWALPRPDAPIHKYGRGHVLVVGGGPTSTGAGRLAATAAQRVGAGVVTLACPPASLVINASHLTEVLIEKVAEVTDIVRLLGERKRNVAIVGPGNGVNEQTRQTVVAALRTNAKCVLDADALTSFAEAPQQLFDAIRPGAVLTPHDGEFARLFPDIATLPTRLERTRAAAERANAVVLLKGADTVVAHPDGRATINGNAPPTLATAGSGDVLAGMIGGLLAQGMDPFSAANAAVWLHGEAGRTFGAGLIASDIVATLPKVLGALPEPGRSPKRIASGVRVASVEAIPFAAASSRVTFAEVPKAIPTLLNRVYDHLSARKVQHAGVNIVLYRPEGAEQYLMEAGVRVDGEVGAGGGVRAANTPAGRVATAAYWGPFNGLPEVHRRIRDWCAANGHLPAGTNWEVYGHWSEDPNEQRTDVFWLLR